MELVTFTSAVEKLFKNPDYQITAKQITDVAPPIEATREINIYNLQPVFTRLLNALNTTNIRTEAGNISLVELIKLRAEFYDAKEKLGHLEQKEMQEVVAIKNSSKWHERSKLVRIFVSSEVGEELEQAESEVKEVASAATTIAQQLEDLESVINYKILHTGEETSPEFKELVSQWRTIGKLKDEAEKARAQMRSAYNYLSSGSSCRNCGYTIMSGGSNASEQYLSAADRQIQQQLATLTPWYNKLSAEVESTIDRVRASLAIAIA